MWRAKHTVTPVQMDSAYCDKGKPRRRFDAPQGYGASYGKGIVDDAQFR
jgi:hypothetical protein